MVRNIKVKSHIREGISVESHNRTINNKKASQGNCPNIINNSNNVKIIRLKEENNKGIIKYSLWRKLDNLQGAIVKDDAEAKRLLEKNGFTFEFQLRDEIFFRGNGIRKTRGLKLYDKERYLRIFN